MRVVVASYPDSNYYSRSLLSPLAYYTAGCGVPAFRMLTDYKVPCAVCRRINISAKTLFITGTPLCPTGFTLDYAGA